MFFKRIYISLFLLGICITANAQLLNFKNYSIEDGLPQSQILDVYQDHLGIIWFATNGGGVGRFDGIKFHNLSTKDGLNNNRVNDIFEDSHHNLWIGSAKGLNQFVNNRVVKISDTLINQTTIYKIHEHSNGEIWFGTSSGIIIFDGKKFREFSENKAIGQYQVWAITQDKLGNIWIGTMINGAFCYDGKKIIHFTKEDGLIDSRCRDIIVKEDKIWIATYRGINIYDPSKRFTGRKTLDTLKISGKPFLETTYRLCKDSDGNVWTGNVTGVSKISYNRIKKIVRNNGLCNGMICGIEQDKEGNMWFGSFAGGISKYKNDLFININEKFGLSNNAVMTFCKDSKENMWIGTWGGGVSRLDYKAWKNQDTLIFENFVAQKGGLPFNNIWSICEDKQGNMWFGTSATGVSVYNGKTFRNFDLRDGLNGLYIHALLCDKKGNVWIAHENGVDKYDGKSFTFYGKEQSIFEQGVNAIYEDKFGNLWFGSPNKITKYDGKKFTSIIRPGGFPRIRNMVIDNLGYMWISTDGGVCVYNGSKFFMITENEGLGSNTIYFVLPDDEGYLWLGTNNGIDRLDLNKFVNQKELVIKHYGKEEGFIGLECNQNAAYKDADGKLWLGTIEGVTIYDPKQEKNNSIPPQTQIMNIRLFLEKMNYSNYADSIKNGLPVNLTLPYDKNHITFDFIGISHTIPDGVKYKFMLQGFDKDWLPEGKEGTTTYSNLSPGQYVFLLKASNNDGVWNADPVEFAFEITPPFWKRPWFYIIVTIIGISLIYAFIKVREQNLQKSRERLKNEVTIRTKELSEEKEKLQKAYSEIDEKNKDITDSIHYAKRIQEAILPPDSLIKQLLPESFVFYKPKDIVSGDFYWLEQWGPQTLIAAVDCTGHGVPGAFMSIVAHNILTQTVNVLGLAKPSLILNETNSQLSKKLNQDPEEATVRDGMDIALCAINYKRGTMEFAGANNPLWIIRNNTVIEVNGDKFPIGAFVGEELQLFTNHEWELQKDDVIYIFTDGFSDQFGGPKGKKFKYKQFQDLLLHIHQKPMAEQKSILEIANAEWQGNLEQIDDVLIIGIRV